jgi:hypothetical protein
MGGACNTHVRDEKCMQYFSRKIWSDDLVVQWKEMLKVVSKTWGCALQCICLVQGRVQ